MFDIQLILDKSNLLQYVESAGATLKGNGDRFSCVCPLHGGADNPTAFSVYKENGEWLWKCFTGGCSDGVKRDAISFVMKWQGLKFREACEWINGGAITDIEGLKISAEKRLEQARIEAIEAEEKYKARLSEFRKAERHLQYHNNLKNRQWMRDLWTKWGIDEGMQDFWYLGGVDDFVLDGEYHTPTLTIPIIGEDNELLNIQHRLVNPKDPKSKYRYDSKGLNADPFLAVPAMGFDGDYVLVMEGSKKAMVTWTVSDNGWQTIGVPSQTLFKSLIERLKPVGSRLIVIPDPNTEKNPNAWRKAYELAKGAGGYFMPVPLQMDDYILSADLKKDDLFKMMKQSRKV